MTIEKLRPSFTFTEERLRELQAVVPEAFADGKINWEVLREALGDHLEDETQEHFGLTWPGKREARRLAALPPQGTLVPVPGEGVNEATTRNLFIEGENLEVLKLLQKSYAGRVKLIYIDPPYNTGNDFIYEDDYGEPLEAYLRRTGQIDESGKVLTTNTRVSGRFHSNWLGMMYPRLLLARKLLRDDGIIFVSIDDNEVHNLRQLMNEVFGDENFVTTIIWQKNYAPKSSARHFSADHDYLLVYSQNADIWKPELLPRTKEQDQVYKNPDNDPRGLWRPNNLAARNYYSKGQYSIRCPGGRLISGPPKGSYWRISEDKLWELDKQGRIWWGTDGNNVPAPKIYLSEVKQGRVPQTLWLYKDVGHTQEAKNELIDIVNFDNTENVLNTLKPTRLLRHILQITTSADEECIILDFFSGSASTAHAVLMHNSDDQGMRQFIMVQFPEPLPIPEAKLKTIADIGKERIRGATAAIQMKSEDLADSDAQERIGFKVLRLERSHFRQWQPIAPITGAQLNDLFAQQSSPLEPNWSSEGLRTEILLLEGFPLDSRQTQLEAVTANTIWRVHHPDVGHELYVCLDDTIAPATLATLKARTLVHGDNIFICLDSALSDEAKVVLDDRLRLKVI
jgi:adenine-specific DNA-methyltransferase